MRKQKKIVSAGVRVLVILLDYLKSQNDSIKIRMREGKL